MAFQLVEISKVRLGDMKEFKTPISFYRILITYDGKPLLIETKCNATPV